MKGKGSWYNPTPPGGMFSLFLSLMIAWPSGNWEKKKEKG